MSKRRLGTPRFQADDVRFLEMDLGGFLDDDDPIFGGNMCGQRVEQRRLSRSSTARDQDVPLFVDRGSKGVSHDWRESAGLYQLTERESRCELSDSQDRPGDGAWREHRGYP